MSGAPVAWESAKMRSHNVNGYPSFSTQNSGFFVRNMRRISSSLPIFSGAASNPSHAHKDKYGDERWASQHASWLGRLKSVFGRMGRKLKLRLLVAGILCFCVLLFYNTREYPAPVPG